MSDDTDGGAILLHLLEVTLNGRKTTFIGPLLGSLGKGLSLGLAEVLVEATAAFLTEVLSPDGLEGSQTLSGVRVTHNTHNNHWGALKNGDGLDNLLLVNLGAGTVNVTNNMGHASLEAHEGS